MKKISVIIATFNRENTINGCLRSIQCAKRKSNFGLEIIVIDDGTDNTSKIVEKFSIDNPEIDVVYYKPPCRLGLAKSRNWGIKKSSGDIVIPLDSDNEIIADAFVHAIEVFDKEQDVDVVFNKSLLKSGEKLIYEKSLDNKIISLYDYINNMPHSEYCCSLRKKFINEHELYEESVWGFEGLLWLRSLAAGRSIYIDDYYTQIYDDLGEDRLSVITQSQATNRVKGNTILLKEFSKYIKKWNMKYYIRIKTNLIFYVLMSDKKFQIYIELIKNKTIDLFSLFVLTLLVIVPASIYLKLFPILMKIRA